MNHAAYPLAAAALAWALLSPLQAQSTRLDLSEKTLVKLASTYVEEYEKKFAYLVADEMYEQVVFEGNRDQWRRRRLKSETYLTYLAADAEWIAIRDVLEVEGNKVLDREDLQPLLARADQIKGLADRLVSINARYNIGRVERNFNEPTLPLLLLEPKRSMHVKFNRKAVAREGDRTWVTLAFAETDGYTLVGGSLGRDPAKGEIELDAATGTIRRTLYQLNRNKVKASLETIYTEDPKFELWLPTLLRERYESTVDGRQTIECEAKYTNYRRWEGTGRIRK